MEKKDGGMGCSIIILLILFFCALSNMIEENKNHIDGLEHEIRELRNELLN